MPEDKEREKKEEWSDIVLIAIPILKFLIVVCLPWILISKLDRQFDRKSEEKFSWWNFYWSFPATHLSWLVLTLLFGLPLCGLVGAPVVLAVCVIAGMTVVGLSTIIPVGIIIAAIWIGLYLGVKRYRSLREVTAVRREVFREEGERGELHRGDVNEE